MFSKIVVSLDGSEQSLRGLYYARGLAADHSAHIEVVHVREVLVGRAVGGRTANVTEDDVIKEIESTVRDLADAGYDIIFRSSRPYTAARHGSSPMSPPE